VKEIHDGAKQTGENRHDIYQVNSHSAIEIILEIKLAIVKKLQRNRRNFINLF